MNLHVSMNIIDGICHLATPTHRYIDYQRFTGNQWNEDWEWDEAKLRKLPHDRLVQIWQECRPTWLLQR